MKNGSLREVVEEASAMIAGRNQLVDIAVPAVVFLAIKTSLGLYCAMWSALVLGLLVAAFRLRRGESFVYALSGIAGVVIALVLTKWFGNSGFWLPGIITNLATTVSSIVSIVMGRPLIALTSYISHRWPMAWYLHPQVRPAYNEVTLVWALFYAFRSAIEAGLVESGAFDLLVVVDFITGWPMMLALIIGSYLYGLRRLRRLGGPSIQEFVAGATPPWSSQRRGF